MELAALRYFLAVVEAGSFSRAAARLEINASAVTRRIAALEDELGVTLLERNRSGVRLTSGGTLVIAEARKMLAIAMTMTEVAQRNGTGKVGRLRVGVRIPPVGEPLRTLLARWRRDHAGVALMLCEMTDHDLHLAIESRRLDVALVAGETAWPNVIAEPLYRERVVVALPIGHALAAEGKVRWVCLQRETMLVQDWSDSHVTRELYTGWLGPGVQLSAHPASKQSILALVGAGFGVTLALKSQSQVAFPGVVFRPIDEPDAYVQVMLAWAADAEDAVVGRFVAFMRDAARSCAFRG